MTRRVMIVGNGDIGDGLADAIDAADLVMRFNDCRSVGAGGGRTDIVVVCNTGRPGKAMTESAAWACNKSVWLASAIWCVRDPAKFRAMTEDIRRDHPELDDFCDDYTDGFADYARKNAKDFHIIPAATHEALDGTLAAYLPGTYVVPSTGAVAIAEFLAHYRKPGDDIFLAGFGHQGWDGHPWAAERVWVDELMATGTLARLVALPPFDKAASRSPNFSEPR
ncbi:MAG: Urease operon accessory protein [Rhizobium sp.]|nr:Urease operon accessory protein [Rhizobium sp.]MBX9455927.1 Urease operon accessory protein [Rhizobium sp.]